MITHTIQLFKQAAILAILWSIPNLGYCQGHLEVSDFHPPLIVDGFGRAQVDGEPVVFNSRGAIVYHLKNEEYHTGLGDRFAVVGKNHSAGTRFFDAQGHLIFHTPAYVGGAIIDPSMEFRYAFPETFSLEGKALIGLLTTDGREIAAPKYKKIEPLARGVWILRLEDGGFELRDTSGRASTYPYWQVINSRRSRSGVGYVYFNDSTNHKGLLKDDGTVLLDPKHEAIVLRPDAAHCIGLTQQNVGLYRLTDGKCLASHSFENGLLSLQPYKDYHFAISMQGAVGYNTAFSSPFYSHRLIFEMDTLGSLDTMMTRKEVAIAEARGTAFFLLYSYLQTSDPDYEPDHNICDYELFDETMHPLYLPRNIKRIQFLSRTHILICIEDQWELVTNVNGKWSVKNKFDGVFYREAYPPFSGFIFQKNGLFGYADSTAHVMVPAKWKRVSELIGSSIHDPQWLLLVTKRGHFGVANSSGKIVIRPRYDSYLRDHYDPFFTLRKGNKGFYFDRSGNMVLEVKCIPKVRD